MTTVSVIVPCRNRPEAACRLIAALNAQSPDKSIGLEIAIALDGTPATKDLDAIAVRSPHQVRLIPLPRVGISAAKNRAVEQTSGEILLFLNDDIIPDKNFIASHVEGLRSCNFKHAVLGHTDWASSKKCAVVDKLISETGMIFFYNGMQAGKTYDFRHAWNMNLSMTRKIFEENAGFAETLSPCMYEDIEMAWRLQRNGHKIFYRPQARALHYHRYTWESYLRREIMLGIMSPVLWEVNKGCFLEIFKRPLKNLVSHAEHALVMDQTDGRRQYKFLEEQLAATAPKTATNLLLNSLYMAHLPTKRRAFRYGLLKAMTNKNLPWQRRQAMAESSKLPDCLFNAQHG